MYGSSSCLLKRFYEMADILPVPRKRWQPKYRARTANPKTLTDDDLEFSRRDTGSSCCEAGQEGQEQQEQQDGQGGQKEADGRHKGRTLLPCEAPYKPIPPWDVPRVSKKRPALPPWRIPYTPKYAQWAPSSKASTALHEIYYMN